ncbi:hypothetical protein [Serinicoccus marinus]|uniref:hypothetical protein n=1 Tax=Serinicoccus marinus TaxID=247333 RepID=UPI0006935ACE|nr:hypothetical protein [Serinicoccus marinus]
MRFSEHFNITRSGDETWFDPLLDQDTPLYVDPFLVFDDKKKRWKSARSDVVDFFEVAAQLVSAAGSAKATAAYSKATSFLRFPEPNEFALGVSMGRPNGSGTGGGFADDMATVLQLVHKHSDVAHLATIQGFDLFSTGIGFDRISDILCNILKARFIDYTQKVAKKHGVPMEPVMVKHASWSKSNARWENKKVMLPKSPTTGGGVLLVPERFLRDMPEVTKDGFFHWADANAAAALRSDFGYLITDELSQPTRRWIAQKFAVKHPDTAMDYIKHVEQLPHLPYDVEVDPRGLVSWREAGVAAGRQLGLTPADQPQTKQDLHDFVDTLADKFKHAVEHTDTWRALWADNQPQTEKIIQAVAAPMWTEACRAADVDLGQEVNRGRGPVDFKFSKGWEMRALLEIKRIHSSGFFTGASRQLPQYLKTEQIDYGVYLCVGYTDEDFSESRLKRVQETIDALGKEAKVTMRLVVVDARRTNKTSASKLKDGKS